jgi:hypothetical protein
VVDTKKDNLTEIILNVGKLSMEGYRLSFFKMIELYLPQITSLILSEHVGLVA